MSSGSILAPLFSVTSTKNLSSDMVSLFKQKYVHANGFAYT